MLIQLQNVNTFAARAMQAILSNHTLLKVVTDVADKNEIDWKDQLSLESCQVADKLIEALNETKNV